MATAFSPSFHDSIYACMMSSTVDSSGILMVLLMAPERNGCAAAIIFRCPRQEIERPPPAGASEQSNTGRRSEEHTSELQSLAYLVCRLLLEKKKDMCS